MEAAGERQRLSMRQGRLQAKHHGALHAAIRNLQSQEEQLLASVGTWLREDQRQTQLLHQRLKELEEAVELEEAWQQQRRREAESPELTLREAVEARMERAERARRRGFCYWLQTLSLLAVGLNVAVAVALAAAAFYASRFDPELFYRLLRRALPAPAYTNLGYALGRLLRVSCAAPLPS